MWGPDYKMAVIGAGPAGLSCAYYLRTRGYDVTVFEKAHRLRVRTALRLGFS